MIMDEDVLECREVYDFANHTITLYAPDGSVLRHDQYTEKSMPAILFRPGEPTHAEIVTEVTYRTREEIARLRAYEASRDR